MLLDYLISEKKMKTIAQETPSSSTEDDLKTILIKEEDDDADLFNNLKDLSPEQLNIINTFPWISDFIKLSQTDIGITTMKGLIKLMKFYEKKVSDSVNECYSRPNRATKLKKTMSDALMFFHMTYCDFRLPNDHSSYLQKMSDLMAMYLDMEIKASRTGTESLPKVASKITSALNIYFGKSQDYIFDTILKSKMITKNSRVLCDLIFRRVLRDSPGLSIDSISYVRHLLVFKIWKAITKDPEEKQAIVKLACLKLQPPPGLLEKLSNSDELRDLLPKIPKYCSDITDFLMRAKFCSREQIKTFLKAVEDPVIFYDWQPYTPNGISSDSDETDTSSVGNIMDDIWSDLTLKPGAFDMFNSGHSNTVELKKNKVQDSKRAKRESRKKKKRIIEIVDLDSNDSIRIKEEDPVSSEKNDLEDMITSSFMHEHSEKIDEIDIVKSEEESDAQVSCMKEVIDNVIMSTNPNIYDEYDDPVASTSCLKDGFDALMEESFHGNLFDYSHSMEDLSDVTVGGKEDMMIWDCKEDSTVPVVTSNSPPRKALKEDSVSQNCEKEEKFNYNPIQFPSNPLLLVQDDKITKSENQSFDNSVSDKQFQTDDSVPLDFPPSKDPPPPVSQEGTRKFKTPAELKLQHFTEEQDIIKLALTARSTKRKNSETEEPPTKGKEKNSKKRAPKKASVPVRKSPRTRKGSLQSAMSSALDELEITDNWIGSST